MGYEPQKDFGTPESRQDAVVTLRIDGRAVTVPVGTSVMRAAAEIGGSIPKLCATDSVKAFGSCRMCLVEVDGMRGTPAMLHALTPADVSQLTAIGLSDIVDLRSSYELNAEGRGPLERERMAFHHTPLFDGDPKAGNQSAPTTMSLGDRYLGLMLVGQAKIANVVRILASAKGGAVYHCAAGKDRTGVISAVLLGALGVPDDLIVADYALSAERIDAIIARVMSMKGYEDALKHMPEDTLHAKPETMERVVGEVASSWGSMAGYLRSAGVDEDVLERLRAKCLA